MKAPLLVVLGACTVPAYTGYVAAVRPAQGGLVAIERCGLDVRGQPTGDCSNDYVAANSTDAAFARAEAASAPQHRAPAPDLAQAMAVVNGRDVRPAIAECGRRYGLDDKLVRFALTIMPSGDVDRVTLHGEHEPMFDDCAREALQAATFAPFDAPPRRFELALAL